MGKKSKRTTKKGGGGGGGGGGSGAAGTMPVGSAISFDGRMPERDGRRFFDLLSFLAELEVPRLEAKRQDLQASGYQPLGWRFPMAANSMWLRSIVMTSILQDIDWLVDQVNNNRQANDLYFRLFGKRLSARDKEDIAGWKLHVEDDFFVVNHRPKEGAVFVQCGRIQTRDKRLGDEFIEKDYHEPRVFVVQGLSDPLASLIQPLVQMFQDEYRSIHEDLPGVNMCLLHTALLPYNGGITYMSVISPSKASHYASILDMKNAAKIAVDAAQQAFVEDGGDGAEESSSAAAVPLYRHICMNNDAHICRLASDPLNYGSDNPGLSQDPETAPRHSAEDTAICLTQMFWTPFADKDDPRSEPILQRIVSGEESSSFLWEGCKNQAMQELFIADKDPCPFHVRFDNQKDNKCFVDCCKSEYLKRKIKAREKSNTGWITIMYEPLDEDEATAIVDQASQRDHNMVMNISKYVRLGYTELGSVQMQLAPSSVAVLKQRLAYCPQFHAVMDYKWIYMGYQPVIMRPLGLMTFGDIELDPFTGLFEGSAMTPRRMTAIIQEMKLLCRGLPILSASLESQPAHKVKPDKETLAKNEALLRMDLKNETSVSAGVNKKGFESIRVYCGFCSATEIDDEVKLFRCACKSAYYCSKEHQKAHWKDHKPKCVEIRNKTAGSSK